MVTSLGKEINRTTQLVGRPNGDGDAADNTPCARSRGAHRSPSGIPVGFPSLLPQIDMEGARVQAESAGTPSKVPVVWEKVVCFGARCKLSRLLAVVAGGVLESRKT